MGKNNRQRRAAKVRRRSRVGGRGIGRPHVDAGPPPTPAQLFVSAAQALHVGDQDTVEWMLGELADLWPDDAVPEVQDRLERDVARLWDHGWQPADIDRIVAKELGDPGARLVRGVIATQAAAYAELGERAAPAWMAQLDALEARPSGEGLGPVLRSVAESWPDALALAVELLALLGYLPAIPTLTEPPSAWREGTVPASVDVPAALLQKIRALLAKAESTTFDAEAEAFTAKAQELMARHRIDRAVLAGAGGAEDDEVLARRIGTDDPYADAKAMLLGGIAEANGARAVWAKGLGSSTVFGYAVELDVIEELYTSLLVQAMAAMRREGSKQDAYGRSRTKSFRRSFLTAYAGRITDRLMEAVEEIVEEAIAETGTDLVPILAARDEAAEAALDATFPDRGTFAPSVSDAEGVFAGRLAADRADLSAGPPLDRRSA